MQRRHQFGQHERARRNIQALAFAGARAEQNRRIHAGECEQHTDDPEPDRHTAVEILHRDQRCQSGRTDDDRPSERHATIQHRDIHHARGPFADRTVTKTEGMEGEPPASPPANPASAFGNITLVTCHLLYSRSTRRGTPSCVVGLRATVRRSTSRNPGRRRPSHA